MNNWFTRFTLWWSRAMYGRHGNDPFSVALLVLYCIFLMISSFTHLWIFSVLALVSLIFCVFRMLSRNQEQRWKENEWFLRWWNPVWSWMRGISSRFRSTQNYATMKARDHGTYKYYKCPKCKNKLRVPVGKGKIEITCPVCHTSFIKRT